MTEVEERLFLWVNKKDGIFSSGWGMVKVP